MINKQKAKPKRLLSLLLALAMLLGMIPAMSLTASAAEMTYIKHVDIQMDAPKAGMSTAEYAATIGVDNKHELSYNNLVVDKLYCYRVDDNSFDQVGTDVPSFEEGGVYVCYVDIVMNDDDGYQFEHDYSEMTVLVNGQTLDNYDYDRENGYVAGFEHDSYTLTYTLYFTATAAEMTYIKHVDIQMDAPKAGMSTAEYAATIGVDNKHELSYNNLVVDKLYCYRVDDNSFDQVGTDVPSFEEGGVYVCYLDIVMNDDDGYQFEHDYSEMTVLVNGQTLDNYDYDKKNGYVAGFEHDSYTLTYTLYFTATGATDPTKPTEPTDPTKPTEPTSPVVQNGTVVINGKTVLYKDGVAVTGTRLTTVAGKTYAVVKGYVLTGKTQTVTISGKTYIVDKNGVVIKATKNKLIKVSSKKWYIINKYGIVIKAKKGNKLVKVGKNTYIVNNKGLVQKSTKNKLVKAGKKSYIVNKKAVVLKNKKAVKVGKKTYKVNKKGIATRKK